MVRASASPSRVASDGSSRLHHPVGHAGGGGGQTGTGTFGGGNGGTTSAPSGNTNTGSGGGGCRNGGSYPGSCGSGVVIIKYTLS